MINDQHKYSGEVDREGKACGEGRLEYGYGGTYEGMFQNNKRQGLGKQIFTSFFRV